VGLSLGWPGGRTCATGQRFHLSPEARLLSATRITWHPRWAAGKVGCHRVARPGTDDRGAKGTLPAPGRELEGTLIGRAGVYRLAVRDDDVLERELEQRAQRRQRPLLMVRGRPDAQLAIRSGERVGENESTLFGQP
jgi:hypothetical protein